MRICLDLDGVICELKKKGQSYSDLSPKPFAVEKINELRNNGHYIIINTARHMKTCNSNLGVLNKKIVKITLDWLEKHDIVYDEIYFAKPWAQVYIDDNAFRFENWDSISGDGTSLPVSNEHKSKV